MPGGLPVLYITTFFSFVWLASTTRVVPFAVRWFANGLMSGVLARSKYTTRLRSHALTLPSIDMSVRELRALQKLKESPDRIRVMIRFAIIVSVGFSAELFNKTVSQLNVWHIFF
jgi:hypothetical protein